MRIFLLPSNEAMEVFKTAYHFRTQARLSGMLQDTTCKCFLKATKNKEAKAKMALVIIPHKKSV